MNNINEHIDNLSLTLLRLKDILEKEIENYCISISQSALNGYIFYKMIKVIENSDPSESINIYFEENISNNFNRDQLERFLKLNIPMLLQDKFEELEELKKSNLSDISKLQELKSEIIIELNRLRDVFQKHNNK